ncbi:MAG: transposase [Bacteroidales bacterium]|nr:transposase [Bacteroidales bacterium]
MLYFSFQTLIFDTYEIYKIKFGKKEAVAEVVAVQKEQPQSTLEEVIPVPVPTPTPVTPTEPISEASPTKEEAPHQAQPIELTITPDLHEKNRADYASREQREKEERIRMVMEYCHYYLPRIADQEIVNHICVEVDKWMESLQYKPKPIPRPLTKDINNIPLRHFVWNISECFLYKKYYNGDNRANFVKALFPKAFAGIDLSTIKNFKVEPLKTEIPIDEPENDKLDFHYPSGFVNEKPFLKQSRY